MVRLTKIFDLLGMDTEITLIYDSETIYTDTCGNCPKVTWCCAYAEGLKYDIESARYIITVKYM